jgi:predicted RNase H-like nuclease
VLEFHPELAWMRLGGGEALPSKSGAHGLLVRLHLLAAITDSEELERVSSSLPDAIKLDDLLDAFVGLHVAHGRMTKEAMCIPADTPERDERGLRMEMWY